MKNALLLAAALTCAALTSCKKESETTPAANVNGTPETVPILKDGSGFRQDIDVMVKLTETSFGLPGQLGVYDFSIDGNNQLNLAYYDEWQSQQDKLKTGYFKAFDLVTKKEKTGVAEPARSLSQQKYVTGTIAYMPYSASLASFGYSDWGSQGYAQAFFGGSLSGDMPMAPTWQGNYSGGIGYYNAYAEQKLNGGKHYLMVKMLPSSATLTAYEYLTPAMPGLGSVNPDKPVVAQFPEPRYPDAQGKSVVISVRADSVFAYRINSVLLPVKTYTLTGSLVSTGLDKKGSYIVQRHYSTDGKKMAMLVYDAVAKKAWTYTYDFTADALAQVLNSADLSYAGAGSDMDLDDAGNVYYSGIAGNGSVSNGVSVYKRSASGVSLVGADNFLKSGEVVRLHVIKDKVYLAVKGNVTGKKAWAQLSLLSQG